MVTIPQAIKLLSKPETRSQGVELITQLAEAKHSEAMTYLGYLYSLGEAPFEKDIQKAKSLFIEGTKRFKTRKQQPTEKKKKKKKRPRKEASMHFLHLE